MLDNKNILILLGLFLLTFTSCQKQDYLTDDEMELLELKREGKSTDVFISDDFQLENRDPDDTRPDDDVDSLHYLDDDIIVDGDDTINDDDEDDIEDDDTINDDDEDDLDEDDQVESINGGDDRSPTLRKSIEHNKAHVK